MNPYIAQVGWREVACYLLSVEEAKRHAEWDCHAGIAAFRDENDSSLLARLTALLPARPNRHPAAEKLLQPGRFTWELRRFRLAELRLGPGKGGSMLARFAKRYQNHPPVCAVAEWIEMTSDAAMDEGMLRLAQIRPVPESQQRLIAVKRERFWRIVDGYHRAIAMYRSGVREVEAYAGTRRETARPSGEKPEPAPVSKQCRRDKAE